MGFKKRKDFTSKKKDSTFSKRKSRSINKELFPGKFVCFFVLFSNVGKIQLWFELKATIQQFDF